MKKSLLDMNLAPKSSLEVQKPSFKTVVQAGPVIAHQWQPVDCVTRSKNLDLAKRRMEEIKRASRSHPHCLKCGDQGHLACECRNATAWFV
jgi:hypothetical protein